MSRRPMKREARRSNAVRPRTVGATAMARSSSASHLASSSSSMQLKDFNSNPEFLENMPSAEGVEAWIDWLGEVQAYAAAHSVHNDDFRSLLKRHKQLIAQIFEEHEAKERWQGEAEKAARRIEEVNLQHYKLGLENEHLCETVGRTREELVHSRHALEDLRLENDRLQKERKQLLRQQREKEDVYEAKKQHWQDAMRREQRVSQSLRNDIKGLNADRTKLTADLKWSNGEMSVWTETQEKLARDNLDHHVKIEKQEMHIKQLEEELAREKRKVNKMKKPQTPNRKISSPFITQS